MCFSATASFVAGGVLTATGIVVLKKAKKKKEIPFAMIPLFFGVQQLIEGVVWLSIYSNNATLNGIASHFYFLFSNIGWPIFVPIAILCIETVWWRKGILTLFECVGLIVAAFFVYFMLINPIVGRVMNHCIVYNYPRQHLNLTVFLYVVATCGSCLISSKKTIQLLGILVFLFFCITVLFYKEALVSVWCFFSAILSAVIYYYFSAKKRS